MTWKGRRTLVLGLGKTGLAAVRFLLDRGAIVVAADRRGADEMAEATAALAGLPVDLHFGEHDDRLWTSCDVVMPSPGVPWNLPGLEVARSHGACVVGELEVAAGELRGHTIGVTGTNGKTTTASLMAYVLRLAGLPCTLAGNIGTPILEVVDESRPEDWNVLELSSFQLEASRSFRCEIATVLNITPDHLDRHGDFPSYVAAKGRILRNQRVTDSAVLNVADPECLALGHLAVGRVSRFGISPGPGVDACIDDGRIIYRGEDVGSADLAIKGAHNLENALAAVSACALAGAPLYDINDAIRTFQPVPHRLEFVRQVRGVDYYNDSKATNVAAAAKALTSFRSGLWAILGGRDKDADYTPLNAALRGRTRAALLVGEAAPLIRGQLNGGVPAIEVGTIAAAVALASERSQPGDTVLLAPACASFDQFENYMERGRSFQRLVEGLEG